jgi:RNA polymerase sigma-70 factor (ECF subfamily)
MTADLLFRNYYRPLCLYALHYLKDVDDAEDVVQDCFVRMMEAEEEPQNARAWLFTAVRNRCIDLLRRHNPLLTGILPEDQDGQISDEEAQERSFSEARLWEAIDQLPVRCREVFLLAKRDGLTYREIAQRLHLSEKTVEHQVSKALKRLRGQRNNFFFIFFL